MNTLRHLATEAPEDFEKLFINLTTSTIEQMEQPMRGRYESAMWASDMKNRNEKDPVIRVFNTTKILQDLGNSIEEEESNA